MASARKATTGATSKTKERTAAARQGGRGAAFRVLITYKYNSDKGHHLGIQTK